MKKLIAGFLLVPVLSVSAAFRFTDREDIPTWAENSIESVREANVMTGFGDGSFRPKQNLNRAEAVMLILRSKKLQFDNPPAQRRFKDVPEDAWFTKAVWKAIEKGWLTGKSDGQFHPGAYLNRAEFAALIYRAFDLKDFAGEGGAYSNANFRDVPSKVWFSQPVFALAGNDLIRNPGQNYEPGELVSRAEAAWTMAQILKMPRLTGESNSNNFSQSSRVDSRRTAIKPRDFNPNQQGYEVERTGLHFEAIKKDTVLELSNDGMYLDLGTIQVRNTLDGDATLDMLQMKLNFDRSNVGPLGNFIVEVRGAGKVREVSVSRTGEIIITGMGAQIAEGDEQVFRVKIKTDRQQSFFSKSGTGKIYLFEADATYHSEFKKENSERTKSVKGAPAIFNQRDLSSFTFTP